MGGQIVPSWRGWGMAGCSVCSRMFNVTYNFRWNRGIENPVFYQFLGKSLYTIISGFFHEIVCCKYLILFMFTLKCYVSILNCSGTEKEPSCHGVKLLKLQYIYGGEGGIRTHRDRWRCSFSGENRSEIEANPF